MKSRNIRQFARLIRRKRWFLPSLDSRAHQRDKHDKSGRLGARLLSKRRLRGQMKLDSSSRLQTPCTGCAYPRKRAWPRCAELRFSRCETIFAGIEQAASDNFWLAAVLQRRSCVFVSGQTSCRKLERARREREPDNLIWKVSRCATGWRPKLRLCRNWRTWRRLLRLLATLIGIDRVSLGIRSTTHYRWEMTNSVYTVFILQ